MRSLIVAIFSLAPLSIVAAQPPLCGDKKAQHADLLSVEQWQSVLNETPGDDPVLEEAIALEKAKYGEEPPNLEKAIRVNWDQARKLILLGAVRQTEQNHNLTVWLITGTGRIYVSREPHIDEIYRVAGIVDPCGVYIQHTTE
jgi:hypothetical protein